MRYRSHEVLTPSTQKVWWNRAIENDIIKYKLELDDEPNKITVPQEAISCTVYSCEVGLHDYALQQYYNEIVNAPLHAAEKSIGLPYKSKKVMTLIYQSGINRYQNIVIEP